MHTLEPYYAWRNHYVASNDPRSPFFDRTYSEFEYSTKVYNYFIHPQWDSIHSPTLFCKICLSIMTNASPSSSSLANGTMPVQRHHAAQTRGD